MWIFQRYSKHANSMCISSEGAWGSMLGVFKEQQGTERVTSRGVRDEIRESADSQTMKGLFRSLKGLWYLC